MLTAARRVRRQCFCCLLVDVARTSAASGILLIMLIHQLTRAECVEILSRTTVGRLACARHGQPYVVPISFYFDESDTSLYSFSMLGRKIEWMRENPKVCVELDEIADRFHWTTVVVIGIYEEVRDRMDAERRRARALDLFHERAQWWLPAAADLSSGQEQGPPVVYRIRVGDLTGRRAARSSPGSLA